MTAKILKFARPYTNDLHDTLRQIARSQQPSIQVWRHLCMSLHANVNVERGTVCPHCRIDERGFFHGAI